MMIEGTEMMRRADWWQPVAEGYIYMEGEPIRRELTDWSEEYPCSMEYEVRPAEEGELFRDARWTKPLKVGDYIDTADVLHTLPESAILVDTAGDAWQREGNHMLCTAIDRAIAFENAILDGPFEILRLEGKQDA